ncbi:DHHC-type zinc finger family protein isoform X2 [Wolffia australiana]
MRQPGYITLPIVAVLALIGYLYYATVFVVIDGWLGLGTAAGIANAAIFSGLAILCLFTYVTAVRRDPGGVPSSFTPDIEDPAVSIHEVKRKSGDLRYCQKCCHYKPPRAHHCRVCKRCILKMDHHCIWINNCVGHGNYKIFFVFVLHAVITCMYSLKGIIRSCWWAVPRTIRMIICGLLLFPLTLALLVLLGWHVYLVSQNKTTIEYYEGVRAMGLAEDNAYAIRHPYDLGVYENLVSILGPSICSWACPVSGYIGPGLHFRTFQDINVSTTPLK